jgi:hypothetical protein
MDVILRLVKESVAEFTVVPVVTVKAKMLNAVRSIDGDRAFAACPLFGFRLFCVRLLGSRRGLGDSGGGRLSDVG